MSTSLPEPLVRSIVALGHDLFAMKLYWVSVSALWFYDYFLTLDDEVAYGWKGKKTPVFWLFLLNRYLCPIFIVITLFVNSCARYGFMEAIETAVLTTIAELFMTLRVWVVLEKRKGVLFVAGAIILWQWGLIIYISSQSSKGTAQPALLLSRSIIPHLPALPNTDPYHICIFISTLTVIPWSEAFLCLALAFDGLAFIAIIYGVSLKVRATSGRAKFRLLKIIQRDGIMYFFVLFSSNLVWIILLLHARPGLKFIHNQPAMVISSIMINRITLNLKRESQNHSVTWGAKTFEANIVNPNTSRGIELVPMACRRALTFAETGFSGKQARHATAISEWKGNFGAGSHC